MKLLEQISIDDLSIEAIAKASGTSKATIYRWWKSKVSVVIDAFIEHHVVNTPIERNLSCKAALVHHMAALIRQYSGRPGRIAAQIIGSGQSDPNILREFRERFHYGRRAAIRELIIEGQQAGEFIADFDVEFIMDVLYAPIYMRLMIGHLPLDDAFARDLADTVLPIIEKSPR